MLDSLLRRQPLLLAAFLIAIFGVIYYLTAPVSVQSGDTGELVTSAYFLRVPHPPGYPLWNLLYHIPTRYLSGGNPFHAAGVFTILITLCWLAGLFWLFQSRMAFAAVAVLASSEVVWRYAILPDVFSLHICFVLLVAAGYRNPSLLRRPLFLFLISLSVAHHHTIIFVFPLFVYAFYQVRSWRLVIHSLVFGILSFSVYFLLFSYHPNDYGSWSWIRSFGDLIGHFLREDYGTLRLHARDEEGYSWLLFFIERLFRDGWSFVLCLAYIVLKYWREVRRELPRIFIIGLSLGFFFLVFNILGKASLDLEGEAVFERFLLQPLFLTAFLLLFLTHIPGVQLPKALALTLLVNAGVNIILNYQVLNFRKNTTIEDYLLNGLRSLPKNSVVFTVGDTKGFGVYYLRDVKKVRRDLIQIHNTFGFDWAVDKFYAHYPGVIIYDPKIKQNVVNKKYRFFTNRISGNVPRDHMVSYYGLWFEISLSDPKAYVRYQCEVTRNFSFRNRPNLADFKGFEVSRYFDLAYGSCYFDQGVELVKGGDLHGARAAFEAALEIAPFHARAQERLCYVYRQLKSGQNHSCEQRLDELLGNMHRQYVLEKY